MSVDLLDPGFRLGSGPRNQHACNGFDKHKRGCVRREKVWTFSALYEVVIRELQPWKGVAVGQDDHLCTISCRHFCRAYRTVGIRVLGQDDDRVGRCNAGKRAAQSGSIAPGNDPPVIEPLGQIGEIVGKTC